ncbi:hypothetical protein C0J52_18171 [Blattella germanica]|nr:hypothetical protein C0J52_18171 [Blattella germanica]
MNIYIEKFRTLPPDRHNCTERWKKIMIGYRMCNFGVSFHPMMSWKCLSTVPNALFDLFERKYGETAEYTHNAIP